MFAYYTFTSRCAYLHERTKQACQHNHKPTLHKFLKIIKEWLLVAKIIKRSSKLMSPNSAANSVVSVFKRLTLSPAATLYYVYIMKVIKNGKESRPGMLLLTEPVPRLTRMLASDWAQNVIIDKHSNELRNWFFLACERQTFLLAHATLRDGSRGGTPSTN